MNWSKLEALLEELQATYKAIIEQMTEDMEQGARV